MCYSMLADCHLQLRQFGEARHHYQKIYERDPDYRDVKSRVDQLLLQLNG